MIFDHFRDGKSKFLAIRLESVSATAATIATASVVIAVAIAIRSSVRIAGNVSGNGARLNLVNQILILFGLRGSKAQSLILVTQSLGLFGVQVVDDAIAQLVNGLEGVAVVRLCVKAVLHIHLLQIAATVGNLAGQVVGVEHALSGVILDSRAGIAATLSHLCRQVVSVLSALIAQSTDSVVNAAEVVVERVVQRGKAVSKAIGLLVNLADKRLLVDGSTDIGLCSTRSATAVTIAATKAAEAIAAPAEQKEDNNPPGASAPHTIAVAVTIVATGTGTDIGGGHFGSSKTHL